MINAIVQSGISSDWIKSNTSHTHVLNLGTIQYDAQKNIPHATCETQKYHTMRKDTQAPLDSSKNMMRNVYVSHYASVGIFTRIRAHLWYLNRLVSKTHTHSVRTKLAWGILYSCIIMLCMACIRFSHHSSCLMCESPGKSFSMRTKATLKMHPTHFHAQNTPSSDKNRKTRRQTVHAADGNIRRHIDASYERRAMCDEEKPHVARAS